MIASHNSQNSHKTEPSAGPPTIIVGAGLAGLYCALKLAPHPVLLISPAPLGSGSSSAWAQGGIAAALDEGDSIEAHLADTISAGAGLVDEKIAKGILSEASESIFDLLALGVPFDQDEKGRLELSREAAHSNNRIVRVKGDMAGKAIMDALIAHVLKTPSISIKSHHRAFELTTHEQQISGIWVENHLTKRPEYFASRNIILATGGIGGLYSVTTNPSQALGSGIAMAARVGATISDAEFVQFHPTAFDTGQNPAPLATEALRGHGAILRNKDGYAFMAQYHRDADLAPRDIVARAVHQQRQAGTGSYLDCRILCEPPEGSEAGPYDFANQFPTVNAYAQSSGLDLKKDMIPVAPAAHYHMGGIWTDKIGQTNVPGLWAIGEVAATGLHGANRLASNSLLEAVVMAKRTAHELRSHKTASAKQRPIQVHNESGSSPLSSTISETERDDDVLQQLRYLMSDYLGVERNWHDMMTLLGFITGQEQETGNAHLANCLLTAKFLVISALERRESRGGHYRSDHPEKDQTSCKHSFISLGHLNALSSDYISLSKSTNPAQKAHL